MKVNLQTKREMKFNILLRFGFGALIATQTFKRGVSRCETRDFNPQEFEI